WFGVETITFTAMDEAGASDFDAAVFTVSAVNDPPVVGDIPDQTVAEGGTFVTFNLDNFVYDVEDVDENITWSYHGNTELIISIDVSRVVTIIIPNLEWNGAETITFTAQDTEGLSDSDNATFSVSSVNDPPDAPYNPQPLNGATNTNLSMTLKVSVYDIDGDILTVYFYNAKDNSLIGTSTGITSGSTASTIWNGLNYRSSYSWYAIANDSNYETRSATWSFSTKTRSGTTPTNIKPIANASKSDTFGFVKELILFDGSLSEDSDGTIINFTWNFDDGTYGYGETVTHAFSEAGSYQVKLTVTDNKDEKDADTITTDILKANHPPTTPSIDGPTTGHKNTPYEFSAVSFDPDNDTIQYLFDWGDGNTTQTDYLPNGTATYQTYTWAKYGEYLITITAFDNQTESGTTTYTILIDVLPINDLIKGYLIDFDSEDTYDFFDNIDTENVTAVGKENITYLIDIDGDGIWDYAYNRQRGVSAYYQYLYDKYYEKLSQDTPGFELVTLLVSLGLIIVIFKRKRNH
ncbi:MAG: PKD domain-containing protein, partial [Candidatus Thermoplasmatota archaeon]|nr:PKD domain-containing protein [Candidatus Thermoplasmatota archaeon]MBU1940246.1 PKD domain-containing protein [Candidatus Thermoplasmatota archaeon]